MNQSLIITKKYVSDFMTQYISLVDSKWIDINDLIEQITKNIPQTMNENDFYNYIADLCIAKASYHTDYNKLAAKICMDRLHKSTHSNIHDVAKILYNNIGKDGKQHSLISQQLYDIIAEHHIQIQNVIDNDRDYLFDYFGIRTLERSYLISINKNIIERPQHMIMRVAIGIHGDDLQSAFTTYNLISQRYFTHATPTLFNAGTNHPQLSSCFLLGINDNMDNILDQIKQIGMISKWAGGIGVHLTSIRGRSSLIRGTNGFSEGLVPLCVVLNKIARYINQGGKRSGSIACYLEPWHNDIFDFCELRKNTGSEDIRARDLFLALWIPDLFMQRVKDNDVWSLMCPDECKGLELVYGEEFNKLYIEYEKQGKFKKQVNARQLWNHILDCQIETGFPYMLYKDNVNKKSNQKNVGIIRSSNLCAEITQYSDGSETAVCNLCSICLPRFVENGVFNYDKLIDVCRVIVRNLNKVIDINYYPTNGAKSSNTKHRPVGIGIQGLSSLYNMLELPFDSVEAESLNKLIFETIYYGCLLESNELAKLYGKYETFDNSPYSQGLLQFHLWDSHELSGRYDWASLIENIKLYGTRNSLLTSLMPTAGTSQIMNCSECFEPIMSNVYVRTTMAGEFLVVNDSLIADLIKHNLWNDDMRKLIIINNGSIQNISSMPQKLKNIYKTAFELKLKSIIKQSIDRGPFIDQSQSMNLFMATPNFQTLTSAHFYGWQNGLKTGMYYLRTTPAVNPIQFGIDIDDIKRLTGNTDVLSLISNDYNLNDDNKNNFKNKPIEPVVESSCRRKKENGIVCLVCSS